MAVTRLALTDFRSYADALLAPGPGFVILTGENGAGKTNILEAVSLLSPGRGLRGAPLSDMARKEGPGGFAVAARLADVDIGTGATSAAPERRQVRINGAPASANSLSDWLSVLWLTPAMDRLFADSASGRRPAQNKGFHSAASTSLIAPRIGHPTRMSNKVEAQPQRTNRRRYRAEVSETSCSHPPRRMRWASRAASRDSPASNRL